MIWQTDHEIPGWTRPASVGGDLEVEPSTIGGETTGRRGDRGRVSDGPSRDSAVEDEDRPVTGGGGGPRPPSTDEHPQPGRGRLYGR